MICQCPALFQCDHLVRDRLRRVFQVMQWTRRRARIRVIRTQASRSCRDDVVCPVFFASLNRTVWCAGLLTPPGRGPPSKSGAVSLARGRDAQRPLGDAEASTLWH